ncbi:zinc ribbon domain-containing protein [Paenibacillus tianjinensis]|uniref:zinc ribbon domain-containing protein n=1 Tax=Paenibacillus tianjinensis TaxID=2810347 RepID=UPI0038CD46C1
MGTHEKLKTQEEHDAIVERFVKNRLMPLSGLLYCEKCGCRMQFRVGKSKKQDQYWRALCYHHYKGGSKYEQ